MENLKLDKMVADIADIKADLKVHIKRSDLAEINIALLREEVEPLKHHVAMWAGAGKLLAVLVAAAAIAKFFVG